MIFNAFQEAVGSAQGSPGSLRADWGRGQWFYFVGFNDTLVIATFSQVHPERTLPGVPRRALTVSRYPWHIAGRSLGGVWSSRALMGAPEAAMRTPGCPLGALWPPLGPSKIIEKPLVFVAFSAMGESGELPGASWRPLRAPWTVHCGFR